MFRVRTFGLLGCEHQGMFRLWVNHTFHTRRLASVILQHGGKVSDLRPSLGPRA